MTILCADDDMADAMLLEMHMERHNITVDHANSVSQSIEKFDLTKHHIAVLDWNLHDGEGIEIAKSIRAKSSTFPIIFLSGAYTDSRLEQAKLYSPLACLEKNTNSQFLSKIVDFIKNTT